MSGWCWKMSRILAISERCSGPGEGAGISGVIMDKCTVDIYNPKTIRSTMGSIFRVPFYITEDLHGTLGQLQEKGIRVYAAHLEGSVCYDEPDYTGGTHS